MTREDAWYTVRDAGGKFITRQHARRVDSINKARRFTEKAHVMNHISTALYLDGACVMRVNGGDVESIGDVRDLKSDLWRRKKERDMRALIRRSKRQTEATIAATNRLSEMLAEMSK